MRSPVESIFFEQKLRWLSHQDQPIFVGRLLEHAYRLYPERIALMCGDKTLTYRQWYQQSCQVSYALYQRGVRPQDRVILYADNSLAFYVFYMAIWQVGAVVVPVNIFLHDKELLHILDDAAPRLVVAQDHYQDRLNTLLERAQSPVELATEQELLLREEIFSEDMNMLRHDLAGDELCLLLYTSGTSGKPKGVMLSSKNIMTNALQSYARFKASGNLADEERFFCVLPLFHAFSQNVCMWLPLILGACVIVVPKIDRKFISEGLTKRPTLFFGFPALYGLLCLMKNASLGSIKMFVSGADMLPDKIRAGFAMLYGRKICSGYGLTEASPVVAVNQCNPEQATDVVGHPLVGIECQIRDDTGTSLAAGHVGTLWIRGDNVMLGYYNAPDLTAQVLCDGWLCTGDLAVLNIDGQLAITGRSKDLIIHKGLNIYPQEIENVLLCHPGVIKAAVVGKQEDASGQIPIAFVAVRCPSKDLEKDLRKLCTDNLAVYKVPRHIICLDDLPMNATGKIDKKQLLTQENTH